MRPIFIRSVDPAYYLSVSGLPENVAGNQGGLGNVEGLTTPPGAVTATIHAAGDGSRLLTIHGLDEMALHLKMSAWFHDDLTIDKRFHFVPAAKLFITIPPSNDRLVLRHLNVDRVLDRSGGDQSQCPRSNDHALLRLQHLRIELERSLTVRHKRHPAAIGPPSRECVAERVPRQVPWPRAIGCGDIHLELAIAVGDKRQPRAVGRVGRVVIETGGSWSTAPGPFRLA